MQITITARHFEITETHKSHAEQEIRRLRRYFDQIIHADLTLVHEKYRYTAELTLRVDGAVMTSKEEAPELTSAIDRTAAKMERRLKKHKAKLQDYRIKRTES